MVGCTRSTAALRHRALLESGDVVVVRHTFIEVLDADSGKAQSLGLSGMSGRRACSDSALLRSADQEMLRQIREEHDDSVEFELNGFSDIDTDSEDKAGPLHCYDFLHSRQVSAESSPGVLCQDTWEDSLPGSGRAEKPPPTEAEHGAQPETFGNSPSGFGDSPTDDHPVTGEDFGMLLSEHTRLVQENRLLREGAQVGPCRTPPEAAPLAQLRVYALQPLQWWVCAGAPAQPAGSYCGSAQEAAPALLGHESYSCMEADSECTPEEIPVSKRTTVMLRNLPNNYSRAMVLKTLDDEGFAGMYDFLYLPIDFKSRACLGYAFVNLVSPEVVGHFWSKFDGFTNWMLPSKKVCSVSWSGPYQGLGAHVARYRNSPVMHSSVPEEYKPAIFASGAQMVFPPPTKSPRAPRMRRGTRVFSG